MNSKAIFIAAALATTGVMLGASPAFARGTCKDVYVQATNKTGKTIKVIDMDYELKGYGKKSEPVKNDEIPNNGFWTLSNNLERASGRETRIIVKYRIQKHASGPFKWSKVYKKYSGFQNCASNSTKYYVTIN